MRLSRTLWQTRFIPGVLAIGLAATASAQHYTVTNLVSDQASSASNTDANLVNGWGLSRSSGSPWWVANNGTNTSTLYDAAGNKMSLVVNVPGAPTGTVYNGGKGFNVVPNSPALFLFITESGTVLGWNPTVDQTNAHVLVTSPGAIYKGVAIATWQGKQYLYAADFHNGRIDVFDDQFQKVTPASSLRGGDRTGVRTIGMLAGLAPFNVQNIGGNLYVAFAKQDDDKHDEVAGAGLGMVAVFTPGGELVRIFEHTPDMNAPWGLALAPGDFGTFSHNLLVGQFGNGEILAYDINTGAYRGLLDDANGAAISIDGLWGLSFGNDATAGPATTLFFAAGPGQESHGAFGTIVPVAGDQEGNSN